MSNPGKYPLPSLPAQYQVASSAPRSTAASDGNQRPSSGKSCYSVIFFNFAVY